LDVQPTSGTMLCPQTGQRLLLSIARALMAATLAPSPTQGCLARA